MATALSAIAMAPASALSLSSLRLAPIHPKFSRRCNNWSHLGCRRVATSRTQMRWAEFPRLSPAGQQLMETVADMMDKELGGLLLPSQTASDVRSFKGANGEGSVTLRAGREGSKVSIPRIRSNSGCMSSFWLWWTHTSRKPALEMIFLTSSLTWKYHFVYVTDT